MSQIVSMIESTFGPNGKYLILTSNKLENEKLKNQNENIKLCNNSNYLLNVCLFFSVIFNL